MQHAYALCHLQVLISYNAHGQQMPASLYDVSDFTNLPVLVWVFIFVMIEPPIMKGNLIQILNIHGCFCI